MADKIVKRKDFAGRFALDKQISMEDAADVGVSPGKGGVIRKDVYGASVEAKKVIEEAKKEAARIKKDAQDILNRVKEKMESEKKRGFDKGKEEGLAKVSALLISANHQKEKMFKDVEQDIIRLVYDIAEKIIGRDLSDRETAIVDLIRQALHASIGQNIIILVNPKDFEAVKANEHSLMQVLDASKTVQIRPNDKVSPKGCLIETEIGTIDAQLTTQLEAIKNALGISNKGFSD